MHNVSHLCSQKRASDQSPRSFNFTSTATFELTFESLELIVSALLCVSLELTQGECEFTARVSTEGTQLCLILVFSVWLCPQNPLMALKLGKVTPVFLSHLPSLDEAKATAASAQHPNHRTPPRRHFLRGLERTPGIRQCDCRVSATLTELGSACSFVLLKTIVCKFTNNSRIWPLQHSTVFPSPKWVVFELVRCAHFTSKRHSLVLVQTYFRWHSQVKSVLVARDRCSGFSLVCSFSVCDLSPSKSWFWEV